MYFVLTQHGLESYGFLSKVKEGKSRFCVRNRHVLTIICMPFYISRRGNDLTAQLDFAAVPRVH